MILVDTNVVSEWMKTPMNAGVRNWLMRQNVGELFLTATSLAELRYGIGILPHGRRRANYEATLEDIVAKFFPGRVLVFDAMAAAAYGELVSQARLRGKAIGVADGQIAAVAAVHGMTVATRDVGPFEAAGVAVVNPWVEGLR